MSTARSPISAAGIHASQGGSTIPAPCTCKCTFDLDCASLPAARSWRPMAATVSARPISSNAATRCARCLLPARLPDLPLLDQGDGSACFQNAHVMGVPGWSFPLALRMPLTGAAKTRRPQRAPAGAIRRSPAPGVSLPTTQRRRNVWRLCSASWSRAMKRQQRRAVGHAGVGGQAANNSLEPTIRDRFVTAPAAARRVSCGNNGEHCCNCIGFCCVSGVCKYPGLQFSKTVAVRATEQISWCGGRYSGSRPGRPGMAPSWARIEKRSPVPLCSTTRPSAIWSNWKTSQRIAVPLAGTPIHSP